MRYLGFTLFLLQIDFILDSICNVVGFCFSAMVRGESCLWDLKPASEQFYPKNEIQSFTLPLNK
jgi:hypothetical protein